MKSVKSLAAILAVVIAAVFGMSVLLTSKEPADHVPATEFSALRAANDLQVISREVHTNADTAAIAAVREYLVNTLEEIGLIVETRTYDNGSGEAAVDVCGTLVGASERSILLVAHYDSNPGLGIGEGPGSHGASDDGYGVSVILETLRCIKAQGDQKNTIRVVFTDAEETTMLGSDAISKDTAYNAMASDAVFNLEARGLSGPAILFETSKNNAALIPFYAKNNPHPASWSLATDVYRVMPNYTDFTAFIEQGMKGLNFSNLYKIEDNHTPRDIYENISLSAIQDYGEQVLPLVYSFAQGNAPDSFESSSDMAWFTFTRGIFVYFPAYLNWIWLGLAVLLMGIYLAMAINQKKFRLRSLMRSLTYLVSAIVIAALGTGLVWLLAQLFGITFRLTNLVGLPAFEWITLSLIVILYLLMALYGYRCMKKGNTYEELLLPAILLSVALCAVFTLFLPGGAFLFSFGAIFASIFGILGLRLKAFSLFSGFLGVWIAAPVVSLLLIALTPGALGVVLMFAAFPLFTAAPSLSLALGEKKTAAAQG